MAGLGNTGLVLGNNGNSRFHPPLECFRNTFPKTQGKVLVNQSMPFPIAEQMEAGHRHVKDDLPGPVSYKKNIQTGRSTWAL